MFNLDIILITDHENSGQEARLRNAKSNELNLNTTHLSSFSTRLDQHQILELRSALPKPGRG
jgi:hypothetical protein